MGGGGDAVGVVLRQYLYGPIVAHGVDELFVEVTTSTHPNTHNHSTSGACRSHQDMDEGGQRVPHEDMHWRVTPMVH